MATVIKRILAREEFWFRWKSKSCPDFVRKSNELLLPIVGAKRKAGEMESNVSCKPTKDTNSSEGSYSKLSKDSSDKLFDIADENVKEVARFLADTCPPLDSLIDVSL